MDMSKCPLYLANGECLQKITSNPRLVSFLFRTDLSVIADKWNDDCKGDLQNCCFVIQKTAIQEDTIKEETKPIESPEETHKTKVSIHKIDNPYLVKTDILVYPIDISLSIDDPLLNKMTLGKVQIELDKFQKPIHMGTVYITSAGDERTKMKAKTIFHSTVAGVSKLVNEEDVRSSTRKALLLAAEQSARNIVFIPADCGTHDINDIARVQLSSLKTFLQQNPDCQIKNIFVVMQDEESYQTFEEYYNRIFV
jgi:O-acetyl-ADP-ribose deacetylase (regulator of RNase III)